MSMLRPTPAIVLAIASFSTIPACGNAPEPQTAATPPAAEPAPSPASETPASETPATPATDAPKPVAAPAAKLGEVSFGDTKVVLEDCPLEPALSSEKNDPIQGIARVKDRLYVADGTTDVRVYAIEPGCKLTLDKSVGEGGIVKAPNKIVMLSGGDDEVLASSGPLDAYLIRGGKIAGACSKRYGALHPSGTWGLTSFVGSDVEKLKVEGDKCSTSTWALKNLGDEKKRVGPMRMINSIGFAGDLALVGGILAGPKETRAVVAFDAEGNEKLRIGSDKPAADDGFGWIHAATECAPGICVADANYRAISIWTKDGKFVGRIKLDQALGLPTPWAQTLAPSPDGLYVGISVRPPSGPRTGKIVRLAFPGG